MRADVQGNPFGWAVFAVVLCETDTAPLGHWLRGLDRFAAEAFRPELDGLSGEPGQFGFHQG